MESKSTVWMIYLLRRLAKYDRAMSGLDANKNGVPDFMEGMMGTPQQTSSVSTSFEAAVPTPRSQPLGCTAQPSRQIHRTVGCSRCLVSCYWPYVYLVLLEFGTSLFGNPGPIQHIRVSLELHKPLDFAL